jgi:hypothetical protein
MIESLLLTAALMGIVGGPHCLAMCGAPCAALIHSTDLPSRRAILLFHLARMLGYALIGALAALSMQALGWLSLYSLAIRPLWSMVHVAALVLGLLLLLRGDIPVQLQMAARWFWQRIQKQIRRKNLHPGGAGLFILGLAWAWLPCGLLYSALMVAALAGQAWQGAAVMACFAVGSGLVLLLGQGLWLGAAAQWRGQLGVRLAGFALSMTSGVALYLALFHNQAPWCLTNG